MGKVQYSGIQTHLGANQSELVKECARNRNCDLLSSIMSVYYYSLVSTVHHLLSYTFHVFPSFIWTYCTYLHGFYMLCFEYFEHFQ
jgi:hypothetical protein